MEKYENFVGYIKQFFHSDIRFYEFSYIYIIILLFLNIFACLIQLIYLLFNKIKLN